MEWISCSKKYESDIDFYIDVFKGKSSSKKPKLLEHYPMTNGAWLLFREGKKKFINLILIERDAQRKILRYKIIDNKHEIYVYNAQFQSCPKHFFESLDSYILWEKEPEKET